MMENGLISPTCAITDKGKSMVKNIEDTCPNMTYPAFTRTLEQNLHKLVKAPEEYISVIHAVLAESGFDILSLPLLTRGLKGWDQQSYLGVGDQKDHTQNSKI
ncbi:MAG TPA: hypothetical protein VIY47_01225, partial [Ignavibacteriaceae bacterium]